VWAAAATVTVFQEMLYGDEVTAEPKGLPSR
jgi:hypothetical protein